MQNVLQSQTRPTRVAAVTALGIIATAGCGNLDAVLGVLGASSTSVTLTLVNETQFNVDPEVYVSTFEIGTNILQDELLTVGENRLELSELSAGQTVTRVFDCDDIKAVKADDAELKTGLGFSPDAETDLFTQGNEFECGDTLTIRYSGGVTGFSARITAQSFNPLSLLETLVSP